MINFPGQFGRGILKTISSGISRPLSQLMAGVRDIGSLDNDRGFVSGIASGVASGVTSVANVANSVVEQFKDRVQAIYPGIIFSMFVQSDCLAKMSVYFHSLTFSFFPYTVKTLFRYTCILELFFYPSTANLKRKCFDSLCMFACSNKVPKLLNPF